MNTTTVLKATFAEMIQKGMLSGIKLVFDGYIDLEVSEPSSEILVLSYLNTYSQFPDAYPYNFNVWGFPELRFENVESYPFKFPFLATTPLDHWDNHKQEFPDKLLVRFLNTEWARATSDRRRAREEIKKKGYDADKVIFIPTTDIEENIGEFISLFYFRNSGYITTVGAPYTGVRAPDVTCWKTPLLRKLRESGLVENGASLIELMMLRVFGKVKSNARDSANSDESAVIEVEPSRRRAYGGIQQLLGQTVNLVAKEGYVSQGNYDKGFIVAPDYTQQDDRIGILSFSENGLYFQDSPLFSKPDAKDASIREMDNLFKMALLANLTFDEINGLLPSMKGKTFHNALLEMNRLDSDRIIEEIKLRVG